MNGQGPRARAIATGALLGDPPPGRTPWAAPHDPNEVPRTGLSAVTATQDYRPDFLSVDQIRPGEPDKGPEGPLPDAPALAPKSTGNGAFEPEKPVATGLEGGAELGSDFSPAVHDKGVVQTDTLRPITAINCAGLTPSTPSSSGPIFEWVNPADLLVNEAYQRDLAERSIKLIRRIVQGWDWTKFKPPVCSLGDDGMEVIDGQHTAIAAATHPGIDKIPVMIVETETVHDRAAAFIGQNMDRLGVTKMQLHKAAVAAGDEDALTIEQVCSRAGVTLSGRQR